MKHLLLAVVLLVTFSATAQNKDEQQILSILDAQSKSWNEGKIDQFMKGYRHSDSLMFIGSSGITYGYDATLKNYYKRYPDRDAMGELTFTILKLNRISNDSYFVIGKWFLKREKNGDIGGHFTLLWKKLKGKWVIVADHSS
ncbi:MAG: nuclear transport factor 2 family protein [Chitinophagaceae bacterium]|nr:nuclear transport factor 2 family protein [Chitinophagaceae bacterium]